MAPLTLEPPLERPLEPPLEGTVAWVRTESARSKLARVEVPAARPLPTVGLLVTLARRPVRKPLAAVLAKKILARHTPVGPLHMRLQVTRLRVSLVALFALERLELVVFRVLMALNIGRFCRYEITLSLVERQW